MPLASAIMDQAASLLNDSAKELYTYDVQLPYLKAAWNKLQLYLQANGVPVMKENSATIEVAANSATITSPSDLIQPIELLERPNNSSALFYYTEEKAIPQMNQIDYIKYWEWREEAININPPLTDREVSLKYWKSLNPVTSSSSNLNVVNGLEYLAAKTAALVARYVMQNSNKSIELEGDTTEALNLILNINARAQQSKHIRPRSYGYKKVRSIMIQD